MNANLLPTIACAGCELVLSRASGDLPFSCPNRAKHDRRDDIDHVLHFDIPPIQRPPDAIHHNPFLRFRHHLFIWRESQRLGVSDEEYRDLVRDLDRRVAEVDGRGFGVTPYHRLERPSVHYKDETGNVAGSHKARHLMGIALYLELIERTASAPYDEPPSLAIASCGNAALAAAVIARAARRHLKVFIPTWAEPGIVSRLADLGAELVVCARHDDDPPGDPCYRRFRAEVQAGALPFSCQGPDNGLTIDGGRTLGFELLEQHQATQAPPLARLFVQVGGGALASSIAQAHGYARACGAHVPALIAVQTHGAYPLVRAWREVRQTGDPLAQIIDQARFHRSRFMRPWERVPTSIATGILDDETYDWWQILRAMAESGGDAILATEEHIAEAAAIARAQGVPVSPTGAAGLAGRLGLGETNETEPSAVIFSGVCR